MKADKRVGGKETKSKACGPPSKTRNKTKSERNDEKDDQKFPTKF